MDACPAEAVRPPEATAAQAPGRGLSEAACKTKAAGAGQGGALLERFLREPSPARALAWWLGPEFSWEGPGLKERVARRLNRDVAQLDGLLNRQLNALLHHPRFQALEASWRGLRYL